jgi:hypothetical protein
VQRATQKHSGPNSAVNPSQVGHRREAEEPAGNTLAHPSHDDGTLDDSDLITQICQVDSILDGAQALLETSCSAQTLVDLARAQLAAMLERIDRAGKEARHGTPEPQAAVPATTEPDRSIWSALSDTETPLASALHLSYLAEWIEKARDLTETVSLAAGNDPKLEAALRARNIAFNNAEWDDNDSQGLVYLHHTLQAQIRTAQEAVSAAMEADRARRQP